ncbi:unnamed protein product [Amoebophrya sp. A25]|nr:unnamed protein product [Amoebophrya sp. A25]|eukprot:GSA25T00003555001.1
MLAAGHHQANSSSSSSSSFASNGISNRPAAAGGIGGPFIGSLGRPGQPGLGRPAPAAPPGATTTGPFAHEFYCRPPPPGPGANDRSRKRVNQGLPVQGRRDYSKEEESAIVLHAMRKEFPKAWRWYTDNKDRLDREAADRAVNSREYSKFRYAMLEYYTKELPEMGKDKPMIKLGVEDFRTILRNATDSHDLKKNERRPDDIKGKWNRHLAEPTGGALHCGAWFWMHAIIARGRFDAFDRSSQGGR